MIVCYQTHGDARNGFLDLDAGVHQGQRAGADGCHRRRAVGFQNVRNHADGVGDVFGNHVLEGAHGKVAVAYLASAHTARCLGVVGRERREVVVKQEPLVAAECGFVHKLFVELGAERHRRERLRFAAGEDCRSVRPGQIADLAPYRADLIHLAAVEAHLLIEHAAADGFLFDVVIVAVDQRCRDIFGCGGLFGIVGCHEFGLDGVEHFGALGLAGAAHACHFVGFGIALLLDFGAELFVVDLVAVNSFFGLANSLCQLHLSLAVFLDFGVCKLQCFKHIGFRHFFHFALHHADVLVGSAHHDVEVGTLELGRARVDLELTVDAAHTHFRNGAVERDVRNSQSSRCGKAGKRIGHHFVIV